MDFKEAKVGAKNIPCVKNNLLNATHAAYCIAVHEKLQDKETVLYNAIGPDVITPLLLTNASTIIGSDINCPSYEFQLDYFKANYWKYIDKKPLFHPQAFWFGMEGNSPESFGKEQEGWTYTQDKLDDDFAYRKMFGFWDQSNINRWDVERLIAIELKKMGFQPADIDLKNDSDNNLTISFSWAYPGEQEKQRKIVYNNNYSPQVSVDAYYQKSLYGDSILKNIQENKQILNDNASVMIGGIYNYNKRWESNEDFRQSIKSILGDDFQELFMPKNFTDKIYALPCGDYFDREMDRFDYGMLLHLFQKKD